MPVGNTDIASMWEGGGSYSTLSSEYLVLHITETVVSGMGAQKVSIGSLVESFVWPVITRLFSRVKCDGQSVLSDADYKRLLKAFGHLGRILQQLEGDENKEQSYLKYWFDTYLAIVFKELDLPPRQEEFEKLGAPFSGYLRRLLKRDLLKRKIDFIYSLQKGAKKMWPSLGKKKESEALEKHKLRITTVKGPVPSAMRETIIETSIEVFRSINTSKARFSSFMPTNGAKLQSNRREGGSHGMTEPMVLPGVGKKGVVPDVSLRPGTNLVRTEWPPVFRCLKGTNGVDHKRRKAENDTAFIGKLPVLNARVETWRQRNYDYFYSNAREILALDEYRGSKAEWRCSPSDAQVQIIPEPGKFRIVTLGDAWIDTTLQPLQGAMLGCWKRMNESTMLRDDLTKRVGEIDQAMPDEECCWCSVDYEAATDLLKRDATLAALAGVVDAPLYEFALASFSPGNVRYPDGSVVKGVEGQFMGHTLSFPLLCVINLAVYRHTIGLWVTRATGDERLRRESVALIMHNNVLVNGDDMLFKAERSFYRLFLEVCKEVGFKTSQGKNYFSPDCAMINSQIFIRKAGVMVRKGYLNLKLIKGTSLKSGDSDALPTQIGRSLSQMVELCPWTLPSVPHALKRWDDDWKGIHFKPNWYLPVHLGGYGFPRKFGPKQVRVTRCQRKLAASMIADPMKALYKGCGFTHSKGQTTTIPIRDYRHCIPNFRMVRGDYVCSEREVTADNCEWLARVAYAVRASYSSADLEREDRRIITQSEIDPRLSPISMSKLRDYLNVQFIANKTFDCPPVGPIRIPKFVTDCETPCAPSVEQRAAEIALNTPEGFSSNPLFGLRSCEKEPGQNFPSFSLISLESHLESSQKSQKLMIETCNEQDYFVCPGSDLYFEDEEILSTLLPVGIAEDVPRVSRRRGSWCL